jgi:hypothetical protein
MNFVIYIYIYIHYYICHEINIAFSYLTKIILLYVLVKPSMRRVTCYEIYTPSLSCISNQSSLLLFLLVFCTVVRTRYCTQPVTIVAQAMFYCTFAHCTHAHALSCAHIASTFNLKTKENEMQLQYSNFTLVQHTASPLTAHQMQSSKRLQYCTVVSVVHTIGPTVTSIFLSFLFQD